MAPVAQTANHERVASPAAVEPLSGWKKVAYDVALLAPKLLFSGAGWVIGFIYGGILGAGLGDAIGAYLGSMVSLGVEIAIRKLRGEAINVKEIAIERLKDALMLSTGSFVGGMIFAPAIHWTAALGAIGDYHFLQSLAVGAITASGFLAGTTSARMLYTAATDKEERNKRYELSRENFWKDTQTASLIILPAETAFAATSLPLFGLTFFLAKKGTSVASQAAYGAITVGTGGFAGKSIEVLTAAAA